MKFNSTKLHIAHIINPVKVDRFSDLLIAQPITFESMRIAKKYSHNKVKVDLITTQYEEDSVIIPDFLRKTGNLSRSILDIGRFKVQRKLPLIKDILDRLYDNSDGADYLVYTNLDIALMPYFYMVIKDIIEKGYDAFVINRRTINNNYKTISQISLMFANVGKRHPGHDCFVFNRSLYPKFKFGTACIGANWIGKVIIANLIYHSSKFQEFKDLHVTFHIGDKRNWRKPEYTDYDQHNEQILYDILKDYSGNDAFCENPIIKKQIKRLGINHNWTTKKKHWFVKSLTMSKLRNLISLLQTNYKSSDKRSHDT